MADTLRSLVVSLEARIDRFEANMKQASDTTTRSMNSINNALGAAKSQFLGLAASVVSVGAAMKAVKDSIALGDELKQVSDSTGVAIDKLDQLSIVAKLNGASLEDVTKGFKGIGKAMIEAQDGASKSAQLFTALGVSVKDSAGNLRGVDAVMGDVAKALNGIENETTRAAVGTAIFGKSYLQIAATLRNYKEDQEKANEILEKFGGVSVQAANLADDLGDKFTLLGEGSKRALLGALVPGMAAVGQAIQELINGGGNLQRGFGQVVSELAEFVSKALINMKRNFEVVGTTIAGVLAAITTGSLEPLRAAREDIKRIVAEAEGARARIATAAKFPGLDDSDQNTRRAAAADRLADATARAAISGKKLNDILGQSGKQAVADYAADIQKLLDEMAKLAGTDGGYSHLIAANQKYQADLRAGKIINEEQVRVLMQTAVALDEQEAEVKRVAAAWESYEKAAKASLDFQKEIDDAIFKANLAIKAQNDALDLEHATLGMTDNARQKYIKTLELENAQREKNVGAVDLLTKQLEKLDRQASDNALLKMAEEAQRAFERATSFASDFFLDLFNNGSKAFKNLWDNFKQLAFRALADISAKQVVLSITGAVGIGGAGLANAASGASSAGGILQGLSSLFGGGFGASGGLLGAAGGFGAAQTAALDSALLTSFGGAFAKLAGGGLTTALGPVIAALPWAGLASIAIPMISKLFDKGPASRTGTFASGDLGSDKSRDVGFSSSSAFGQFGIAKDFWLGPEAIASFKPTLDAITALDNTIARMVGGDLTKQITDALASHEITVNLGKEGTDINASGGPAQILKDRYVTVLSAIDAQLGAMVESFQGTGDELAKFVVGLVALKTTLGDAFKGLQSADVKALADAVGGIDKLVSSLSFVNANFVTEADNAVRAQQALVDSFRNLGLGVPATHQAFRDLLSSFDLTTESGRRLYASVLNLSGAFVEVNGTATQAAAALHESFANLDAALASFRGVSPAEQQTSQLESLIQQLRTSTGNAWAQMSPQDFAANLATIGHEDFSRYSAANQALITQIISLAAAIRNSAPPVGGGGSTFVEPIRPPELPVDTSLADTERLLQLFDAISGQTTGNYGEKLSLQIRLVTGAMADAANRNLPGVASLLQVANQRFSTSLTLFQSLSTRYTSDIAEQLVKLTETYNDQKTQLQGNASGLDALNQVFEEQWTAIINGTASGVDGTIAQLQKLREGILDYVDSLKIGADSPLTPLQKFAEARSQYEATLARASSGDQTALSEITRSADAYLRIARDLYASSETYTGVFNKVTGQLTQLGTQSAPQQTTTYGAREMTAADFQDVATATGTPAETWQAQWAATQTADRENAEMISSTLSQAIYDAILVLAQSNTEDANTISANLDATKAAIVEAITVGLK